MAAFETRSLVTGQHSRIVVPVVYSCVTVLFIVVAQNPWKVIWTCASCISHLLNRSRWSVAADLLLNLLLNWDILMCASDRWCSFLSRLFAFSSVHLLHTRRHVPVLENSSLNNCTITKKTVAYLNSPLESVNFFFSLKSDKGSFSKTHPLQRVVARSCPCSAHFSRNELQRGFNI